MAWVLKQKGLFEAKRLQLADEVVKLSDGGIVGGGKVRYDEIDSVLLSRTHGLSLTWGTRAFSIRVRPGLEAERAVLDELLRRIRATQA